MGKHADVFSGSKGSIETSFRMLKATPEAGSSLFDSGGTGVASLRKELRRLL